MLGAAGNVEFYHNVIFKVFSRFEHIMYIKMSELFLPWTSNQADINYMPYCIRLIKVHQDRVS